MRSLAATLALLAPLSAQTTWYVDVHAPAPGLGTQAQPYKSIQYAHNQATTLAGDTLSVAPGVYSETLLLTKGLVVEAPAGPLATLIRPAGTATAVRLEFDTQLRGFSVTRAGNGASPVVRVFEGSLERCIVLGRPTATAVNVEMFASLQHCWVSGGNVGVAVQGVGGGAVLSNTIVWGNATDTDLSGIVDVRYCAGFANGFSGQSTIGSFQGDPLAVSFAAHDFHLTSSSPCIDAGDPAAPLDPDGSRADIGPLPFDASYAPFSVYCTAKTNSQGCLPAIAASGAPSFSSGLPFTITCTNELNNKQGLLFYGFTSNSIPYQGGFLCVKNPVRRTAPFNSGGNAGPDDCSGVYSFDFNALVRSGADPLLEPGREFFAQYWSRDPAASFSTNRSDALRARIQP